MDAIILLLCVVSATYTHIFRFEDVHGVVNLIKFNKQIKNDAGAGQK